MADGIENFSKPVLERMPPDQFQYILTQKTITHVPVCEQEPADVVSEVISVASFEIKACFPVSSSNRTVVSMHLP